MIKWFVNHRELYCDNRFCLCGYSEYGQKLLRFKGTPEDGIIPPLQFGSQTEILLGDNYGT